MNSIPSIFEPLFFSFYLDPLLLIPVFLVVAIVIAILLSRKMFLKTHPKHEFVFIHVFSMICVGLTFLSMIWFGFSLLYGIGYASKDNISMILRAHPEMKSDLQDLINSSFLPTTRDELKKAYFLKLQKEETGN